jgi:thymidylate kinase
MSKLIVIRGNSGSGKTTLALKLLQLLPNSALIEQDYFIKYTTVSKTSEQEAARRARIFSAVKNTLADNEIVILEGVFDSRRYKDYFTDLLHYHPANNFFYYIDLAFEETLRRHNTRDKRNQFGAEAMTGWYIAHDQFGYDFEDIFDANITIEDAVKHITMSVTG